MAYVDFAILLFKTYVSVRIKDINDSFHGCVIVVSSISMVSFVSVS